jgi:hypothetical protein
VKAFDKNVSKWGLHCTRTAQNGIHGPFFVDLFIRYLRHTLAFSKREIQLSDVHNSVHTS